MAKLALILLAVCLFGQSYALSIGKNAKIDIIVSMKGGVEGVHERLRAQTYVNREARLNAVYDALTKHRDAAQQPFLDFLNAKRVWHESLWISNQVYVPNVDSKLLEEIQKFPGVSSVNPNEEIQLDEPIVGDDQVGIQAEWGVERIQAPQAWASGWRGAGAKVGVIDTGARHTHQAISGSYVGTANYGWRDPYQTTAQPVDNNGHGTHCTGTIAGSESSGIGVAPGAQWMSCRGCGPTGSCAQAQLLTCAQFMTCPTNPSGGSPICSRAPHIVSNSWGGGTTGTWYNAAMQGWQSAGIVGVFAQGNSGPACSTANYPGNSQLVIGVGATTSNDALASFSSKGPVVGTSRVKPDCSAPGNNVRSSYHTSDTAYSSLSGTSMACPHVAGALALMFGKNPNLSVAAARSLLYNNTDRSLPSTGQNCGGVNESTFPNNAQGWGRINAFRSTQAA